MAICHISAKASVSRGAGRSSTAAAAYRAGICITDERTGEVHDYRRKGGVESSELVMPGDSIADRAEFWNGVEKHHKRGDAMVAREVVIALPAELWADDRKRLAHGFAKELVKDYGIAIDVSIHLPGKEGDERNHHAHLLMTACHVKLDGSLGKKCNELDPIHCKRNGVENLAERFRGRWADMVNKSLQERGIKERVDHRTLKAQGLDREPTQHLGPVGSGLKRRGIPNLVQQRIDQQISDRLRQARDEGAALERQRVVLEESVISLSTDVYAAAEAQLYATLEAAATTRLEAKKRAEAAQRDAAAAQVEADKRKALEAATVASAPATLYPTALAGVTNETLATVPGILPAAAIQQAVVERIQELRTIQTAAPVSIAMLGLEVAQQPVYRERLKAADDRDDRAQQTLDELAPMGKIKRMLNNADAIEANARQIRKDAQREREQIDKDIDRSPEMQAAIRINAQSADQRKQIAFEVKEMDEIALRTERGESVWKQPSHVTRLPEAIVKVLDHAREIAASMVAKMQAIDVEALLKRAIEMKWTQPENVNSVKMAQSRFVQTPAQVQAQRVRAQEKTNSRDQGHGM
ncbi:MAG: MobA/MobL family protein [Rhodoferax sp.]|nr:MobA/MobL family protein [Rhodoferax sp.]